MDLEFLWIVFLNSFFEFWWELIKAFRTQWFHIEFNEFFLQIKFLLTTMTFKMKITISFFQGTYYFILKDFRVIRDTNGNKYLPHNKMTTTTIKIPNYPQVAWFRVRIHLYNKIADNTDITVQLIVMSFTIRHIVGTKEILNLKDFRTSHFIIMLIEYRRISKVPLNWRMAVHTWHKQSVQDDIAFEVHLHIFPLKTSLQFYSRGMRPVLMYTYRTTTCCTDWNSHLVMTWKAIKFPSNITCFMIQIIFAIWTCKMIWVIWVTPKSKWFAIYYFHALLWFQKNAIG